MRRRNTPRAQSANNVRLNGMPVDDLLATRIMWAHHIGYGLPDYLTELSTTPNKQFYNDNAPLELYTNYNSPRPVYGIARLLESGINGLQVDIINGTWAGNPFVMMGDFLADADATHANPNPNERFYIAPCIDSPGFTEDDLKTYLQSYIAKAQAENHPSLAKVNGKYVIYFYGASGISNLSILPSYNATAIATSTGIWQRIRTWINTNNIPLYLIRDIGFNVAYNGGRLETRGVTPWNTYFDASYAFDMITPSFWRDAVPFLNTQRLRYFGGLQPEYNRESTWGGFVDANGTSLLRTSLALIERSETIRWNNIVTWGDFVENTQVRPTTNWHKTRADIVNFYSAKQRGIAPLHTTPTLYITTRMFVVAGEPFLAEAMVINPTSSSTSTTIQLYAADKKTKIGTAVTATVSGGTTGSATTIDSLIATTTDVGKTFYAYATSYDAAGAQLESVWSAPIGVYDTLQDPAGASNNTPDMSWQANNWPYDNIRPGYSPYLTRYRYYSIPAYAALSLAPTLTISGNPGLITNPLTTPDANKPTATVTAPVGVTIRSIELLQNTQLVARVISTDSSTPSTLSVPVPAGDQSQKYLNYHQVNPKGYYVARVITSDEKVSYSAPLYFT